MKTTIDIPDALYSTAKGIAGTRGVSMRVFVIQALERAIHKDDQRPWMSSFGVLAHEADAVYRAGRSAEEDLSRIDPEEWT